MRGKAIWRAERKRTDRVRSSEGSGKCKENTVQASTSARSARQNQRAQRPGLLRTQNTDAIDRARRCKWCWTQSRGVSKRPTYFLENRVLRSTSKPTAVIPSQPMIAIPSPLHRHFQLHWTHFPAPVQHAIKTTTADTLAITEVKRPSLIPL